VVKETKYIRQKKENMKNINKTPIDKVIFPIDDLGGLIFMFCDFNKRILNLKLFMD
jgi:hypothetical protein